MSVESSAAVIENWKLTSMTHITNKIWGSHGDVGLPGSKDTWACR